MFLLYLRVPYLFGVPNPFPLILDLDARVPLTASGNPEFGNSHSCVVFRPLELKAVMPTWNQKVWRVVAFKAAYEGFGPLFYVPLGSRYLQPP